MQRVTAGQFRHLGDGRYAFKDAADIQLDVKTPSRVVGDVLARNSLFCSNLGSFYYQLRKRAGLLGTGQSSSRGSVTKNPPWEQAVSGMYELLTLITSNMEHGQVELVESNLGAIHDLVARLLDAGQEWLRLFKPLVERRKHLRQEIDVLEKELGDHAQLVYEFTLDQVDRLATMGLISESDAQASRRLSFLKTELEELHEQFHHGLSGGLAPSPTSRSAERVRMVDLLQRGIIVPGMMFRLKQTGAVATVTDTGQLDVEGTLFDSPSAAGGAVLNRSSSGWREWEFQDADGCWKAVDELRQRLLIK